ncbi:MAG TPA: hypothetical protein VHX38_17325 [Pseudonocardiaceae bacterium]|jgi:hypothetical protein|nr:hypothetical protein [Pseudonocardiaceae bacterium]
MPVLNLPNTGGLIASNTLNLTRVTTAIAGALGLVTAGSGLGLSGNEDDFAGLDSSQRVAVIVALIGAVAIIHVADLLARSIATSRAVNSSVVALPTSRAAVQTIDTTSKGVRQGSGDPGRRRRHGLLRR